MSAPIAVPESQPAPSRLTLRLRHHRDAPKAARRALRDLCRTVHVPDATVENAALVTGELITSSTRQCRHGEVVVTFEARPTQVTVRVQDSATDRSPFQGAQSAGGQRSWTVVRRVARTWGCANTGHGREVWAAIGS